MHLHVFPHPRITAMPILLIPLPLQPFPFLSFHRASWKHLCHAVAQWSAISLIQDVWRARDSFTAAQNCGLFLKWSRKHGKIGCLTRTLSRWRSKRSLHQTKEIKLNRALVWPELTFLDSDLELARFVCSCVTCRLKTGKNEPVRDSQIVVNRKK